MHLYVLRGEPRRRWADDERHQAGGALELGAITGWKVTAARFASPRDTV